MAEFLTNSAALNEIALIEQEVAQKDFSLDVMILRWEATIARVRAPYRFGQGESQ